MISTADLITIANERLADAEALLATNRFDGAAYLCGYAIEIALKYKICVTLNWSDFPQTGGEFKNYSSLRTHDLDVLLRFSGVESQVKSSHLACYFMKDIIEKLIKVEKKTSEDRGKYDLFAVFLREDSPNRWDIVVSSDWLRNNKSEGLTYLAKNITEVLNKDELLLISRIVIIDEGDQTLPLLKQAMDVEHGSVEIGQSNFLGLQIKHAYLITSRNNQAA